MSDSFKHLLDHDESSSPVSSSTQPCTKRFKKSFDPGSDNDNDQKLCPSNLNVEKGKERAISEPVTTNPQDPFDVFDAGIVHIIITELDAPDTETLRRVSKLWKASSEAHCGRTLLRQHFPEASLCENELGSIEEENLRFRRHLYRRQSFQLGYATRAIRCTGASSWDLKNHSFLWSNSGGEVAIRTLRAASVSVHDPAQVADTVIDLRRIPIPFCYITKVLLLKNGDLIVQSFVRHDKRRMRPVKGRRNQSGRNSTARVNRVGEVVWEITSCPRTWSKPAIGETGVYFVIEGPDWDAGPDCNTSAPKLVKFSMQDGLVVPGFLPIRREAGTKNINLSPDALILTNHEKFAVWTDVDHIISIISTSNRERVHTFHKDSTASILKSIVDESIWVIDYRLYDAAPDALLYDWVTEHTHMAECSFFLPWEETSTDFKIKPVHFPSMLQINRLMWEFDGDSAAFFRVTVTSRPTNPSQWRPGRLRGEEPEPEPKPVERIEEVTGSFAKVTLAVTHRVPPIIPDHIYFDSDKPPVDVSLPTSTGQPGQRRLLDMKIRFEWRMDFWREKEEGYFRMAENYLIHHSPAEEEVVVIDFWPSW